MIKNFLHTLSNFNGLTIGSEVQQISEQCLRESIHTLMFLLFHTLSDTSAQENFTLINFVFSSSGAFCVLGCGTSVLRHDTRPRGASFLQPNLMLGVKYKIYKP